MLHTRTAVCTAIQLGGCKASQPNRVESKVMTAAEQHIFVRAKSQNSPLADNAAMLSDGKEALSHYCAAWHGLDGQNTDVPSASPVSPQVPLLSSREGQAYTDDQLKWVIDYGLWPYGMPGFKGTLIDDEILSVVVYLRHLLSAGSLGEPEMYSH